MKYTSLSHDEDNYWRPHYASRPYYEQGLTYDAYQPAYHTGYEGYVRLWNSGKSFAEVEPELRREYEHNYGALGMGWEKAKHAVRDAWERVEQIYRRDR